VLTAGNGQHAMPAPDTPPRSLETTHCTERGSCACVCVCVCVRVRVCVCMLESVSNIIKGKKKLSLLGRKEMYVYKGIQRRITFFLE
jgi:hypothetical protein